MTVRVQALENAIFEGTTAYLAESTFAYGLFDKHGEEGETRAKKILFLLGEFKKIKDANNSATTNEDHELRILALADAILMPFLGGPTLKNYICRVIDRNEAFDDHAIKMCLSASSNGEYGSDTTTYISEAIQQEIKRKSGANETEPTLFRAKRVQCLNTPRALVNVAMFNAYNKVANDGYAQSLILKSPSCTIS